MIDENCSEDEIQKEINRRWAHNSLNNFKGSVLFTTHDHEFAQTVGNRILELTPNGAIDRYMTFDEYLEDEKIKELRKKMYS